MKLTTVTVIVKSEEDPWSLASAELVPISFVFDDEAEARQFFTHAQDLYGLSATIVSTSIDTYDSAIQALVESIGPSDN